VDQIDGPRGPLQELRPALFFKRLQQARDAGRSEMLIDGGTNRRKGRRRQSNAGQSLNDIADRATPILAAMRGARGQCAQF
jgi:hypothetical protein